MQPDTHHDHSAPAETNSETAGRFLNPFALFKPSIKAIGYNFGTIVLLILSAIASIIPIGLIVAAVDVWAKAEKTSGLSAGGIVILSLFILLVAVALVILYTALIAVGLHGVRNQKIKFRQALRIGYSRAWAFFSLSVFTGVIILVGFILLIVPGFYMLRRYILAPYYLIDKNLSVTEAMNQSAADSKQFGKAVWGLVGVEILLFIIGLVPGIGKIISSPLNLLYGFGPAKRYDEIQTTLKANPAHVMHANPVS
jgi:hypothetical protein